MGERGELLLAAGADRALTNAHVESGGSSCGVEGTRGGTRRVRRI